MSYRDQAIQTYKDTLRNRGLSDTMIQILIAAFDTGFSAGAVNDEDERAQLTMIDSLLDTPTVN